MPEYIRVVDPVLAWSTLYFLVDIILHQHVRVALCSAWPVLELVNLHKLLLRQSDNFESTRDALNRLA